jgi:hypothetical protein
MRGEAPAGFSGRSRAESNAALTQARHVIGGARSRADDLWDNPMDRLSDEELGVIVALAQPLHPHRRGAFLQAVIEEVSKHAAIGPGLVSRIARAMQQSFAGRMPATGH